MIIDNENFKSFISGLTTGEGSFFISLHKIKNSDKKQLRAVFCILMNEKEKQLLEDIKDFFKCGELVYRKQYRNSKPCYMYNVRKIKDLWEIIIPFFDEYRLRGTKLVNYLIWKECIERIYDGEHNTKEGYRTILLLRENLNRDSQHRRIKQEKLENDIRQK